VLHCFLADSPALDLLRSILRGTALYMWRAHHYMGVRVSHLEISIEKTQRGVRITNRSRERVRVVSVTLSYRYTVASTASRYDQQYASRIGSEKSSPMSDLDPGSSLEIPFDLPDMLVSAEIVVERGMERYVISRNF